MPNLKEKNVTGFVVKCDCCDNALQFHFEEGDPDKYLIFTNKKEALMHAVDCGLTGIRQVELKIIGEEINK